MHSRSRAYFDLLRLQFFFVWPLLFSSGYLLATSIYGNFSWFDLLRVVLIGFFGFEGGFVLNDYIDRNYDRKDIETGKLTRYWRLFGTRPIPSGQISPRSARTLFLLLVIATASLILTLPFPHSLFVLILMIYCYSVETFYQVVKRNQRFPVAQLVGRTDFALFPVAGYFCAGVPDLPAALYFLFFYPFAMAHLGMNDLVDIKNDRARGMNTVTTFYGLDGTAYWIAGFSALHAIAAIFFASLVGWIGRAGILIGILLLLIANGILVRTRDTETALRILPLFHIAMLFYAGAIAADSLL